MLSAFLVYFNHEAKALGISNHIRYSMSCHDEVWFICREGFERQCSVALIRAHIAVWALLTKRLGIQDLPVNRLVFNIKVDVTKCLRKEVYQKINTPDFKYDKLGYSYQVNRKTGKLEKITYD